VKQIDFKFAYSKKACGFECLLYERNYRIKFMIFLYTDHKTTNGGGDYVVEFQRRIGDVVIFNKYYRQVGGWTAV